MVQVLARERLSGAARECVDIIRRSSAAAVQLVTEILEATRADATALHLESRPFDALDICEEVVSSLVSMRHSPEVELALDVPLSVSTGRVGDSARFRQITTNLVANALKFTREGRVTLVVDGDREQLIVTVDDTGIGIPEEDQRRIFDAFTQVDDSDTRRQGGVGLGLSIVQQLVRAAEGDITLESTVGRGTRIRVRLPWPSSDKAISSTLLDTMERPLPDPYPLKGIAVTHVGRGPATQVHLEQSLARLGATLVTPKAANEHTYAIVGTGVDTAPLALRCVSAQPLEVVEEPEWAIARLSLPVSRRMLRRLFGSVRMLDDSRPEPARVAPVLIVEDNPINQVVATRLLERLGYATHVVGSGTEAVAAITDQRFSLVLMACQMPQMDGFEATRHIRTLEAERGVAPDPILAMTASVGDEARARSLDAGMNGHLSKPVDLEPLRQTVAEWTAHVVST